MSNLYKTIVQYYYYFFIFLNKISINCRDLYTRIILSNALKITLDDATYNNG